MSAVGTKVKNHRSFHESKAKKKDSRIGDQFKTLRNRSERKKKKRKENEREGRRKSTEDFVSVFTWLRFIPHTLCRDR